MEALSSSDASIASAPARRLHLGCGSHAVSGWVNVDGSWSARIAKHPWLTRALRMLPIAPAGLLQQTWSREILVHDVRKRLPFADASFDAIYASHLLEHLYLKEAEGLLADGYRLLRPGGVIRLVVPDLRTIVSRYIADKEQIEQRREDLEVSG